MKPNEYMLDEYLSLYGDGDYGPGGDVLLTEEFQNGRKND